MPVPRQNLNFQRCASWSFCVQVRWEAIVRFVDIGGIDDHHCLNFLFVIVYFMNMPRLTFPFSLDIQHNEQVNTLIVVMIAAIFEPTFGTCELTVKFFLKLLQLCNSFLSKNIIPQTTSISKELSLLYLVNIFIPGSMLVLIYCFSHKKMFRLAVKIGNVFRIIILSIVFVASLQSTFL